MAAQPVQNWHDHYRSLLYGRDGGDNIIEELQLCYPLPPA